MKQLIILLTISMISSSAYGQIINFTDSELKKFLINENCVDTLSSGSWKGQTDVDINNDNEIQVSEALAVKKLILQDFSNSYSIQLLDDLAQFHNLVSLTIQMSILEFDKVQLDSLKSLFFIDVGTIKKIDISNLPNLTDALQIDGVTTLDTLNLRNGTVPNLFSLFYTQNIKYACVDSIAKEYNAFATFGAMMFNTTPSINCNTIGIEEKSDIKNETHIFPNPTTGLVYLNSIHKIDELQIFNILGQAVFETYRLSNSIDISALDPGVYFITIRIKDSYLTRKIILN